MDGSLVTKIGTDLQVMLYNTVCMQKNHKLSNSLGFPLRSIVPSPGLALTIPPWRCVGCGLINGTSTPSTDSQ